MIQHIVMLSLRGDASNAELQNIMQGLNSLREHMPGFHALQHGENRDFEQKSQDYPYGFVCTFADKESLQKYADHPEHKKLGARLVALCRGGVSGIWVADIDIR